MKRMHAPTKTFRCYLPLSNWVLGFDRYRQVFDKTALPSTHYPDATYVVANDDPIEWHVHVQAKAQALVDRWGVPGDRVICLHATLPVQGPREACAVPNTHTGTGIGWRWPSPVLPLTGQGWRTEDGLWVTVPHETLTAAAYALDTVHAQAWSACAPRTFSVLPIAKACNAACAFCFSKASVSDAVIPDRLDLSSVRAWARWPPPAAPSGP